MKNSPIQETVVSRIGEFLFHAYGIFVSYQ